MLNPDSEHFFKIILVGDVHSGKTEFLNRWVNDKFLESYISTIGIDFKMKKITYQNKNIKLQIYDFSGQKIFLPVITAYVKGYALALIVLAADIAKTEKIAQIEKWQKFIHDNYHTEPKPIIAIIETKCDLPNAKPLTSEDLELYKGTYVFHQTFSSKSADGQLLLTQSLRSIMPQLIDASISINNKSTLSSLAHHAPALPIVTISEPLNLEHITNYQAKLILISLKAILIHGPLNEINKSYNLSIFGGGKPVVDDAGTACIVPDHVKQWVEQISPIQRQEVDFNKALLSRIFNEINDSALNKPFSRSSTTQDFYRNSLPSLIKHFVTSTPENEHLNYFVIRAKIASFDANAAYHILREIRHKLIIGPSHVDKIKPYQIGIFGGKKFTTQDGNYIKVPDHVASILEFIDRDIHLTSDQDKLLTVYHYLVIARHSNCSSRNESTQSFYDSLPIFVADQVSKINIQPKPPSLTL